MVSNGDRGGVSTAGGATVGSESTAQGPKGGLAVCRGRLRLLTLVLHLFVLARLAA